MTTIAKITGIEILDSRGNPTVEADVFLADGSMGRAAVPSGASTGEHEAVELRDGDKSRYLGKGTRKAVEHINREIAAALHGQGCRAAGADRPHHDRARRHAEQGAPGRECHPGRLDGRRARGGDVAAARPLYRYLGGVAACLLPVPMMNILNGGAHADNSVDLQEFMIVPYGARAIFRSAAHGRRSVPHAEGRPEEDAATRPRSATKAALRPT